MSPGSLATIPLNTFVGFYLRTARARGSAVRVAWSSSVEYRLALTTFGGVSADFVPMNSLTNVPRSAFRGVCWHRPSGRWRAYCGRAHLGLYDSEVDAAIVAFRARQEHRYRFTEPMDLEELSDFLGPIPTSRRWSWRRVPGPDVDAGTVAPGGTRSNFEQVRADPGDDNLGD